MGDLNLTPGFKLSPSPQEALEIYLRRKILNPHPHLPVDAIVDAIPTVDIFSCGEPRLIPFGEFEIGPENEWHFYTSKRNESRIQTSRGYWEEIKCNVVRGSFECVGFMRELVFKYENPEHKEDEKEWYIHEYRAHRGNFTAHELFFFREEVSTLVLCKVFCKEPPSSSDDSI